MNLGDKNNADPVRAYGRFHPVYILRNKVTGEVFLPVNIEDAQISRYDMSQRILKTKIKKFSYQDKSDDFFGLPEINKEWMKNAEVVRIEEYKIGYFFKNVVYDSIILKEKKDYEEKGGMRTYFYETGELQWECPDARDYLNTSCINYCNKESFCREFYKSGNLKSEAVYDSQKDRSFVKEYYDSGELMYEYEYVDHKLDGIVRKYDKNGELLSEKIFEKGKLKEKN